MYCTLVNWLCYWINIVLFTIYGLQTTNQHGNYWVCCDKPPALLFALGQRRKCRRQQISQHFGEEPPECRGACDVCAEAGRETCNLFFSVFFWGDAAKRLGQMCLHCMYAWPVIDIHLDLWLRHWIVISRVSKLLWFLSCSCRMMCQGWVMWIHVVKLTGRQNDIKWCSCWQWEYIDRCVLKYAVCLYTLLIGGPSSFFPWFTNSTS